MKKLIALLLALVMVFALGACAKDDPAAAPDGNTPETDAPETDTPETDAPDNGGDAEPMYIPVMAKGFQHQFWQAVKAGADAAAADLGVEIYFDGPASETEIDAQVNMVKNELAKNPKAMALAALSTDSVTEILEECAEKDIPVIGFDSGVPGDTTGAVKATASTNNETAAAIAAEKFNENEALVAAMQAATSENPIVIGCLSQDAVSATTEATAVQTAANSLLATQGITAIFCSNEGAVTGFLAAVSDGQDLADGGKYEDLIVAGFDSGSAQKNAVREGWFYGSVTQDPYSIGYNAVEMAYKAAIDEAVSDVDTGAKWYNAENIDDEDIALLVYD